MSGNGSFSGNPKTEWLVDQQGNDRNMLLLEDFAYVDPDGRKWNAPQGSVINGASIPRPLWSLVGSPYTDDYRRASVVHDVACNTPGVERKDADVMFYHACLAGGCSVAQARQLYAGVRIGAWSSAAMAPGIFSAGRLLFRVPFKILPEEQRLQAKFHAVAAELAALHDEASLAEVDAILDRHR